MQMTWIRTADRMEMELTNIEEWQPNGCNNADSDDDGVSDGEGISK